MAEEQHGILTPPASEAEFVEDDLLLPDIHEFVQAPFQNIMEPWALVAGDSYNNPTPSDMAVIGKWLKEAYDDLIAHEATVAWPDTSHSVLQHPLQYGTDLQVHPRPGGGHIFVVSPPVCQVLSLAISEIHVDLWQLREELIILGYPVSGQEAPFDALAALEIPYLQPVWAGTGFLEFVSQPWTDLASIALVSQQIQLWLNLMPLQVAMLARHIGATTMPHYNHDLFFSNPVCIAMFEWHDEYLQELYPEAH